MSDVRCATNPAVRSEFSHRINGHTAAAANSRSGALAGCGARRGKLIEDCLPTIAGSAMNLPLEKRLRLGVQGIHRRIESDPGAWLPSIAEMRDVVGRVDRAGYDSI